MDPPCSHLHMIRDVTPSSHRLRGLPAHRRHLGAPPVVPHVRPRRVLRPVEEPARDQALPRRAPPADPVVPAGRGLAVVLRRRGHDGAGLSGIQLAAGAEDVHGRDEHDRRRAPAEEPPGDEQRHRRRVSGDRLRPVDREDHGGPRVGPAPGHGEERVRLGPARPAVGRSSSRIDAAPGAARRAVDSAGPEASARGSGDAGHRRGPRSRPSTRTRPASGSRWPESRCRRVRVPDPSGPHSARSSPRSAVSDTRWTSERPQRRMLTSEASSAGTGRSLRGYLGSPNLRDPGG